MSRASAPTEQYSTKPIPIYNRLYPFQKNIAEIAFLCHILNCLEITAESSYNMTYRIGNENLGKVVYAGNKPIFWYCDRDFLKRT